MKLFLLSGCLLLVGVAEVTLREAWKEIPLRNMAVEIILLSSFPSAQIIPTLSRKKYPTNKTKQKQKKTHKKPQQAKGPIKARLAPGFWGSAEVLLMLAYSSVQTNLSL